jgi:hypothetical protein
MAWDEATNARRSEAQKAYWAAHPEARQRMREVRLAQIERMRANGIYHGPAMYFQPGHEVTPEMRAKIGAAHRGKVVSPETRAKMSAALKGHVYNSSPDARARLKARTGAARGGRPRGTGRCLDRTAFLRALMAAFHNVWFVDRLPLTQKAIARRLNIAVSTLNTRLAQTGIDWQTARTAFDAHWEDCPMNYHRWGNIIREPCTAQLRHPNE